jgi:hypothetical protein
MGAPGSAVGSHRVRVRAGAAGTALSTDLLLVGAAPAPTLERFCAALYTALADGKVLDEAVYAGRRALYWTPEEWIGQDFGPPIVYLRNSLPVIAPHVRRPYGGRR